jgi:hypothetical protein
VASAFCKSVILCPTYVDHWNKSIFLGLRANCRTDALRHLRLCWSIHSQDGHALPDLVLCYPDDSPERHHACRGMSAVQDALQGELGLAVEACPQRLKPQRLAALFVALKRCSTQKLFFPKAVPSEAIHSKCCSLNYPTQAKRGVVVQVSQYTAGSTVIPSQFYRRGICFAAQRADSSRGRAALRNDNFK